LCGTWTHAGFFGSSTEAAEWVARDEVTWRVARSILFD
jgi:hypothetical protein